MWEASLGLGWDRKISGQAQEGAGVEKNLLHQVAGLFIIQLIFFLIRMAIPCRETRYGRFFSIKPLRFKKKMYLCSRKRVPCPSG